MDEIRVFEIRQRAYDLWQAAGRPNGRHLEFWALAEKEIEGRAEDDALAEGLKQTFPASDPPATTSPSARVRAG